MNTTWNDMPGNRRRLKIALLVTADGQPHLFSGSNIPNVCQCTVINKEKRGWMSNTTWSILHHDTTQFVSWLQDWETGESWPQRSWGEGFRWLATKAPLLQPEPFDTFIRSNFPKAATKWDETAAAEEQFGPGPSAAELLNRIEAAKAEILRLNNEAEEARKATLQLEKINQELHYAKKEWDEASLRLSKAKEQAASLSGLCEKKLKLEAHSMNIEAANLEKKLYDQSKKAELGNSLGSALDMLFPQKS